MCKPLTIWGISMIELGSRLLKSQSSRLHNLIRTKDALVDLALAKKVWFSSATLFSAGFLFGASVSIGLGLTTLATIVFGLVVAFGVVVSRSLVSYLVIQTITLAAITGVLFIAFRTIPFFVLDAQVIQVVYFTLILLSPIVCVLPKSRTSLSKIAAPATVEFVSVGLFAFLVQVLRGRMPSDPTYALSQMYGAEDNAGIIDVLSHSLHFGYSSHATLLGEFTNGIYLAAAGVIGWFGTQTDQGLLAALTHWNMTLLFLAWMPLAALVALSLSGIKARITSAIFLVAVMTAVQVLIFWPFTNFGHTSVISSGLFAIALVSLTLNYKLVASNPILFALIAISLGLSITTIWFPLAPFAAASVALVFVFLLVNAYRSGKKATTTVLSVIFVLSLLSFLPFVLDYVSQNVTLLQAAGGTRVASVYLILVFLGISGTVIWKLTKRKRATSPGETNLFVLTLSLLFGSNLYLFVNGLATNGGSSGYGASKYLLTSIAIGIPVLWMIMVSYKKIETLLRVIAAGLALVLGVVIFQPDSQPVAISFVSPTPTIDVAAANSGVFKALGDALEQKPDHILCVADYGFPLLDGREAFPAYACTRWGQSLAQNKTDAPGSQWSFVFLNRIPVESMEAVRDSLVGQKVVIIRFPDPSQPLLIADTWWKDYVDDSWQIITVR